MINFEEYFGESTQQVLAELRNRVRSHRLIMELERQQKVIAKRIRRFEQTHETKFRVARSRLHSAITNHEKAAAEERDCWQSYQQQSAKVDSFPKCLGITFASVLSSRPGVRAIISRANEQAVAWQIASQALLEEERELSTLQSEFHLLANEIESDRFAIQTLSSQIQKAKQQVRRSENAITDCIRQTARHTSYQSLVRKTRLGLANTQAFFDEVRRLRRLLNRINTLKQIGGAATCSNDQYEGQLLKTAIDESLEENKLSLECEVHLRGKGILKRTTSSFSQGVGQEPGSDHVRVYLSETKPFKLHILQKRWTSETLGNQFSHQTLSALNAAIGNSAKAETARIIKQLETETAVVTRRLAERILSDATL